MDDSVAGVTPEQVHEALLSLYSPTELAKSELAGSLPEAKSVTELVQRAQLLRGLLLDAIQALRPANRMAPSPSASRAYDCLKLRYVSGLSVEDVAYELSLSSRQAYRDLRWAEERVADLLSSRSLAHSAPSSELHPQPQEALVQEAETIARKPERVSLVETTRGALSAISLVAGRHGVTLSYHEPERDVVITSTPGILRQVVTQLLSSVVQSANGAAAIEVQMASTERLATLSINCGQMTKLSRPDLLEAALRVAEAHGIGCQVKLTETAMLLQLAFSIAERYKVLILEDKPGASALYSRYLENTELEPVHLDNPNLAVDAAVSERADAVLLDIMMPETDGWTVLQALKMDPRTKAVPVVICSVIDDRELGFSLGAADYLTKPVSRTDLVDSLRRVVRRP